MFLDAFWFKIRHYIYRFNLTKRMQMTDEIKNTEEKGQDVGKKLTGFLGGLAEKAKNIDVKDLTEKAKQKVGEVKDMASELSTGKNETSAQPREEIPAELAKELFQKAQSSADALPPVINAELADLIPGETIVCKIKTGFATDPAYLILTNKTLLFFTRASDQFAAAVYPLASVAAFSINPPRNDAAGRFSILTDAGEIKTTLNGVDTYFKAVLLYRKLREALKK